MALSWHAEDLTAIYGELQTNEAGLRADEATRRLKEDGFNSLPETKPDGYPIIFLRQFQSPLIYILLIASAAVFFLGEVTDGSVILAVLLFNAIVGTIQEGRAQNTLRALKRYVETTATVVRDGTEITIPDYEVVRGDILVLREGEKIPADARLVALSGLKVDEAALTGESEPVGKTVEIIDKKNIPVAEQKNMVFKGTNIFIGNGQAVVVATGVNTVIGTIAKEISSIDTEIPLKANIRYLSHAIIAVVGVISAALFIFGLIRGEETITIFATVVSLAVSVIPEGLPIVITLVLATGVWRMSKRNALVKKLQAVEALGQARVIAVDKTGTITKNELVVREVWADNKTFSISGIGYEPEGSVTLNGSIVDAANHPELLLVGKMAALGANARVFFSKSEQRWRVAGDPTEAAIRVFGEKTGFKKDDALRESPLVSEIPFDYQLKYHAAVFGAEENNLLVVSGAPETVLALSVHIRRDGKNHPFGHDNHEEAKRMFAEMSGRGLRVVAIAMREKFSGPLSPDAIENLTFIGFFGMQDILRPEVAEAMARASSAGIKVVMITGDYTLTARAIAKEAGVWREGDEILTGAEMDGMSDDELKVRVARVSVFARVTPEHKLRIINAYKKRGEIIAMTGDGVNDAPSLVAADLGVAMGKAGTEVAKEAADIVLLDDNFGNIVSAVEEGRSIYKTIKKVILYLFAGSWGQVLTILGSLFIGFPLPLLPAQIIWLNFVTDGFLDVSLAMEPKEEGLLRGNFERPKKYLIDKLMVKRVVFMAIPMMIGALFVFSEYFRDDLAKAWTMTLTTLAMFHWFNAWNCRHESRSIFQMNPFSNMFLVGATLIIIFLQLLAVYNPLMQKFLHTVPLELSEWLMIIPIAVSVIAVEEIRKYFYRRRIS
ncbi:HAD-IC family P-type ATPase [Candidatus Kaiserbacteria bacterium]|nr:HAD-IC family P-type ATPase [Candidatus Kaiserbacteria bacterium]